MFLLDSLMCLPSEWVESEVQLILSGSLTYLGVGWF